MLRGIMLTLLLQSKPCGAMHQGSMHLVFSHSNLCAARLYTFDSSHCKLYANIASRHVTFCLCAPRAPSCMVLSQYRLHILCTADDVLHFDVQRL